jgi:hypothetical protein
MAQTTATKAPKAVRVETAKALTKAQQTALETLVKAANESITGAINSERELANVVTQLADFKVYAARSMARLSTHPAVIASRGTQAGQPALTKMATLIGRPATTLETYWKSAKALIGAKMQNRTAAPTQAERDLVMASFKSESARVASYSKPGAKGRKPAGKPATKGTSVTVETLNGQAAALLQSVDKFTKDNGFTKDQADALIMALDAIHDAIETASAK